MPRIRGSSRHPVDLLGSLLVPSPGGAPQLLSARTLDLSRTGVGVVVPVPLCLGQSVLVALRERTPESRWVCRRLGRVANVSERPDGRRIGIAFDERSDANPHRTHESSARTRWPRLVIPTPLLAALVIVAALAGDQASKAWAFATASPSGELRAIVPGLFTGIPLRNDGAVGHVAGGSPFIGRVCALSCGLICVGAAFRLRGRRESGGRVETVGLSLLVAGMLGNSFDRLALGYVRDFLIASAWPDWGFNLADVFILAGAALLLACGLTRVHFERLWRRAGSLRSRSIPATDMAARAGA